MKKHYVLIICIFASSYLFAQPEICGPNASMEAFCSNACIICDLDGYSGNNGGILGGVGPEGFCTTVQHNIQWIGFIANSENITLELEVSNCIPPQPFWPFTTGLEIGIYETFDCINTTLVTNCEGGQQAILNGTSGTISNVNPLVVGQYYYFVMDGQYGSICDYQVNIIEGSTEIPSLDPITGFDGVFASCVGGTFNYSIDPVYGAPTTLWYLDGTAVAFGEEVTIPFNTAGVYELCVEATNLCSPPSIACQEIIISDDSPVQVIDTLCVGECYDVNSTISFCNAGEYFLELESSIGCDSFLNLILIQPPPNDTTITDIICEGDTAFIGNEFFTETGNYSIGFPSFLGCDSVVNLDLVVNPINNILYEEQICEGEIFPLEGMDYNETGFYEIILTDAEGCVSTTTLDLEVIAPIETPLDICICQGEIYQVGDIDFSETGDYLIPLQATSGCDSLVNLTLEVMDIFQVDLMENICDGESVQVGEDIFETSGMYEVILLAENGCDSIINLDLNVNPNPQILLQEQRCLGETIQIGDEVFNESGNYEVVLSTTEGCDSTIMLDLQVIPPNEFFINEQLCQGENYIVDNQSYEESGTYEINLSATSGCDSIVYLDLVVDPIFEIPIAAQICEGEVFQIGNEIFDQTGQYELVLTSSQGCDSTIFLNLNILDVLETTLNESICEGGSVQVGEEVFTEEGAYTVQLLSNTGCDSIITLNLQEIEPPKTFLNQDICEGESFQIGTQSFSESGNYEVVLLTSNNCDSTVYLDLNINPNVETFLSETICAGESFLIDNQTITEGGDYTFQFVSAANCDSLVQLNLEVIPPKIEMLNQQICEGQEFIIGNQIITNGGLYEIPFTAVSGCDSLVMLYLEILETQRTTLTENICEGENFEIENEIFDQTGLYELAYTSITGCDSIVTVDLTVLTNPETNLNEQICQGDSIQVGNQFYKQDGFYEVTLNAVNSCDSTIFLNLQTVASIENTLSQDICEGTSFTIDNQTFTESGEYDLFYTSAAGCDSIVHLDLRVIPIAQVPVQAQICEGQSYQVGSELFTEVGQYEVPLISSIGCDSIVLLDLAIVDIINVNLSELICDGETFEVGNESFTTAGEYAVNFISTAGCDSIVTLNLDIAELPETFLSEAICEGESYQIGNESFDTNGSFEVILMDQNNCDSTVYLDLQINLNQQTFLTESICEGSTFEIDNQVLDTEGEYNFQYTSATNCDSLVRLDLQVIPPIFTSLPQQICSGESLTIGTQTFTESGQYEIPFIAASGCDSIVQLDLEILAFLETDIEEFICEGESVEIGEETFFQNGIHVVNLIASTGCDSTVTLDLNIFDIPNGEEIHEICQGEIIEIGTEIFSESGAYEILLTSVEGCDSIVQLDLEVHPNEATFLNPTICEDEVFMIENESFNESGEYQVLLNTYEGCDSLVDLNLTVLQFDTTYLIEEICEEEFFQIDNQSFNQSGDYEVILAASTGCDSIVLLNLNVIICEVISSIAGSDVDCFEADNGSLIFSIQKGTPPFQYNWMNNNPGGLSGEGIVENLNQNITLTNLNAGDYTITIEDNLGFIDILNYTIIQPEALVGTLEDVQFLNYNVLCQGDENGLLQAQGFGGTPPYQYLWNTGAQGADLENIGAGNYEVTVIDQNGCSIILNESLNEPAALDFDFTASQPDCIVETGTIDIQNIMGGVPPYMIAIEEDSFTNEISFNGLAIGDYNVIVQDINGCETDAIINIPPIPEFNGDIINELTLTLGDSIQLIPTFNTTPRSITWQGEAMSCYDCLEPFVRPLESGFYTLLAISEYGCEHQEEIYIQVDKVYDIFVPNAFSPNNDGINDVFTVFANPSIVEVREMKIYSRWGELIFQNNDFPPNDKDFGWDGIFLGQLMNPSVFVWTVEVEFIDGTIQFLKGDVTLVKN